MADQIIFETNDSPQPQKRTAASKEKVSGKPAEGKIAQAIGSGENAKNSFIWITIRYSFLIASIVTAAIYFRPLYCEVGTDKNLIEDIKSIWAIFMPVITLALGYAFGKGR